MTDLRPHVAQMAKAIESGGGTAHAETIAFQLAQHVGLLESQSIRKTATKALAGDAHSSLAALVAVA